jgi:hypothetical protein
MTEEEKVETINKNAAVVLERFLREIEEKTLDENDFISETYARLIVASILGFSPSNLADDAEEAADNLFKMVEEEDEENT